MTVTSCQFGCGFERDWRPAVLNHERKCRLAPDWEPDRSKCGTPPGADLHRKYGERPCDPCRLARNEDSRARQVPKRREPQALTCRTCGVEFMAVVRRKYCTEHCERRDPEIMERQRLFAAASRARLGPRSEVTCQLCGASAMVSDRSVKFCSHDCSVLWRLDHPEEDPRKRDRPWHCTDLVHLGSLEQYPDPREIVERQCRYCGGAFEAERRSQKHCCGDRCRSNFLKYGRPRQFDDGRTWKLIISGPCEWCGTNFTDVATCIEKAGRYCSKRCQRYATKSRHGKFVIKPSVRQAIYERDGWTCQLCAEPVDPDLGPADPWGATLDHIVCRAWTDEPDHSPSNLRLAHRWCNSLRGDESHPEALTLFAN